LNGIGNNMTLQWHPGRPRCFPGGRNFMIILSVADSQKCDALTNGLYFLIVGAQKQFGSVYSGMQTMATIERQCSRRPILPFTAANDMMQWDLREALASSHFDVMKIRHGTKSWSLRPSGSLFRTSHFALRKYQPDSHISKEAELCFGDLSLHSDGTEKTVCDVIVVFE
jgi:hypothetical protein